ncbi:MAG: methionyl-tRNA formyltransferase [Gammaproteobacteria bacterium]|nr:methionyl-tRNA formyltransferase [Gammaproteobacteria bacterium]
MNDLGDKTRSSLRILFAGTSAFGLPALKALQTSQHSLCAVITQPNKPQGRGQKINESPVAQFAKQNNFLLYQPSSLKEQTLISELKALKLDVMIVISYGLLLPPWLLHLPRYGCLNVHASLLPRWRGAAPIQRAIESGDSETGVSILQMTERLDAGPVWLQAKTPITSADTAASLHDTLAEIGAEALLSVVSKLGSSLFMPSPQDETLANTAPKIQKTEGLIAWRLPAATLERKIRAFNPWPVAYTYLEGTSIRIWEAKLFSMPSAVHPPGMIGEATSGGIVVACGEGFLQLTHLQLPGKRILPVCDILHAHNHPFKAGRMFHDTT